MTLFRQHVTLQSCSSFECSGNPKSGNHPKDASHCKVIVLLSTDNSNFIRMCLCPTQYYSIGESAWQMVSDLYFSNFHFRWYDSTTESDRTGQKPLLLEKHPVLERALTLLPPVVKDMDPLICTPDKMYTMPFIRPSLADQLWYGRISPWS